MPGSFRYSRWDGTQKGFEVDADDLLSELTDDLLYHGELDAALRRLLQDGLLDKDGNRLAGLRELIERLRQRRREELAKHDLGGVYDDIAKALREVVETERAAVDDLERQAQESGDPRRQDVTGQAMAERRMELDLLPPDLAGLVKALEAYDFVSPAAAQRFQELMDDLRQQVLDSRFQSTRWPGSMGSVTPEEMARFKDMLAALNAMLDERSRGEEPDFAGFMEEYGDLFPENPQTLDELLEAMARRMAAMQAFLNSLTPEQRAQLQALSAQLLDDMDLRWQVDQLTQHLRGAFPGEGWDRRFQTAARPAGAVARATLWAWPRPSTSSDRLGALDQLEHLLSSAPSPGALAEVDFDVARELLGDDGARSLERLAELARTHGRGRPHREPGGPAGADAPRACGPSAATPWATCSRAWRRTRWAGTRWSGRVPATSGATPPSPTSGATRSISTSSAPCATPSPGAAGARPCACSRTTSRSSAPRRSPGRAPSCSSTCRCRCP